MNRLSTGRIVTDPGAVAYPPTAARSSLIWIAWIATLLLSNLPLVIARDLLGTDIPWIAPAWVGTAILLFAATYVWPALKPLRSYFATMGVIVLVSFVISPAITGSAAWQAVFPPESTMIFLFGTRLLLVLLALIVLSVVFLMGYSRREAFLTTGNLAAPVQGLNFPGKRRLTWPVFGTAVAFLLSMPFIAFLTSQTTMTLSTLAQALPWLPLILVSAVLNAFGEEAMYRAAPLATLHPVVGAGHAIWLTSLWFGLGHYYGGTPSGPAGMVGVSLLALLLGKAMLDTRGMGWSLIIHIIIDTMIYTTMAMNA